MYSNLAVMVLFAFVYSVIAGRVERSAVTGPIIFIAFGLIAGPYGFGFLDMDVQDVELRVVADQFGCPTYTEELAKAMISLVEANAQSGVYHFSSEGETSWHGFAEAIVEELKAMGASVKVSQVVPVKTGEFPTVAERPAYSVMSKDKFSSAAGWRPAPWRETLSEYLKLHFINSL